MLDFIACLLIVCGIVTYLGLKNRDFFDRYSFQTHAILGNREWFRLLTSGFLHVDWFHFAVNAFTLYSFGNYLELIFGAGVLAFLFVGSTIGGSLLSLAFHRHQLDYCAVGASGGACGVVFASLFLLPGGSIMMFPVPVPIPAWLYAILFLFATSYGIKSQRDNIGHDAHLGGALVGVLIAGILQPKLVASQPLLLTGVVLIGGGFLYWQFRHLVRLRPSRLAPRSYSHAGGARSRVYEENARRNAMQAEINRILDKISQNGLHSLSPEERAQLEAYSADQRRTGRS